MRFCFSLYDVKMEVVKKKQLSFRVFAVLWKSWKKMAACQMWMREWLGRSRQCVLSLVQRELEANEKTQIMFCKLGSFVFVLRGFLQALSGCCQKWLIYCAEKTETCLKNLRMKTGSDCLSDRLFSIPSLFLFLHPQNCVLKHYIS